MLLMYFGHSMYSLLSFVFEGVKQLLTIFIPMDYPIHIDTISMELSIIYFKGLSDNNSIKSCISAPEDCFYSSKQ